MTYLSLYRRRRPLTFADMAGQEHITRTLSNALLSERLAHAYLLCGPRGTGKTTAAKILARAMNCAAYPTAEPCGKCSSCRNIAAGVSIDVIEMDAASNRGIDEIRELRERSRFASGESRYKVYIIDEAHMLTPEACNAFLKTLEEPPPNVVFILATTDPSRLPATIVSRCQRFDFHLLTSGQIHSRLERVSEGEGWQADEEALYLIARLAEGSLRDALGILEQCAAYGEEQITAEQVRIVTGSTRAETVAALVKAVLDNNFDSGLKVINEVVYSGRDLALFMRDLTSIFSRLLLVNPADGEKAGDFSGMAALVSGLGKNVERRLLLDVIELLHQTAGELRNAHFPQYVLEIAFIRLLRVLHGRLLPAQGLHLDEMLAGKEKMSDWGRQEQQTQLPVAARADSPAGKGSDQEEEGENAKTGDKEAPGTAPAAVDFTNGDRLEGLRVAWPGLLEEIKKRQKTTAAWLEPAQLDDCRGDLVRLRYAPEYDIHRLRIMEDNHRKLLEAVLSNFFGTVMKVKAETGLTAEKQPENKIVSGSVIDKQVTESRSEQAAGGDIQDTPAVAPPAKKALSAEEAQKLLGGKIIEH